MKKILAIVATALVLGAPVVGSQVASAAGAQAQRCTALEQQFDKAAPAHKMVKNYTDEQLVTMRRGGHDPAKVYAAFKAATESKDRPTVILAKTVKGYGLGEAGEGRNISHNQKKLNEEELREFRTRFGIPISGEDVAMTPFYRPTEKSAEMKYLHEHRTKLGGYVPGRPMVPLPMQVRSLNDYTEMTESSGERDRGDRGDDGN